MELRDWLLYIHIVAGMIWLGGAIFFQLLGLWAARHPDPARSSDGARTLVWVGPRVVVPALAITLLAGIALVLESSVWDFSMTWILIALVVVVASLASFFVYYFPASRRVIAIFDDQGPGPPLFSLWGRIVLISRINVLLLIVVLGVMIFKPGA
ncbi:MAG: DUF2269 family protein [Acidimicrobiia bacterium]